LLRLNQAFETLVKNAVTVNYNQIVRTDFMLQVGTVSQKVVVTASTPPLSTDDASVREIIGEQSVAELPLNGRDPL